MNIEEKRDCEAARLRVDVIEAGLPFHLLATLSPSAV